MGASGNAPILAKAGADVSTDAPHAPDRGDGVRKTMPPISQIETVFGALVDKRLAEVAGMEADLKLQVRVRCSPSLLLLPPLLLLPLPPSLLPLPPTQHTCHA